MTRAEALKLAAELVNARFATTAGRGYENGTPKVHEWSQAVLRLAHFLLPDEKGGAGDEGADSLP
jgi:hypothetical protein